MNTTRSLACGVCLGAALLFGGGCPADDTAEGEDTGTETGDGDGDPTTGDGDPTTGDGDGDPTTGDGDGDPGDGDGDGDPGDGDGDPGDGDGDPGDPIANLIEFLGGEDALESMTGFRSEASGSRRIQGEGQSAGDPAFESGTFDAVTAVDFTNDAARVDYDRVISFLGGLPLSYSELYNADRGYIEGDDAVLVPGPTDAAMLSSRWASGRKQMALLHPHILLREVIAGTRPAMVSNTVIEGCGAVIEVEDTVSPINLCVGANGELLSLHTMVNDFLLRDVDVTVVAGIVR